MSIVALGEAEALAAGAVPIMAAGTVINATSKMIPRGTKSKKKCKHCGRIANYKAMTCSGPHCKKHAHHCDFGRWRTL